jgi:hypothetical protein
MEKLFENWNETKAALLEGLSPRKQQIVSKALDNQKHYLTETATTGTVSGGDIAGFRKILLPMVRRVIPGTIASELVGVQPMQGPVGLVYSMRYKYVDEVQAGSGDTNPFGDGDINAGDEMFGNSPALRQFYSGASDTGSPFDTEETVAAGATPDATSGGLGNGWGGADGKDRDGASSTVNLARDQDTHGNWGGGYASNIEGSGGRRVKMEVMSQAVEAYTRKLQAGWTIEAMQDLQSQHGLDIEAELTQGISAEIVQEIDAEIIADLLSLAGTTGAFDYATTGSSGEYMPAYVGDRFSNIGVVINAVANEIGRKTRRGVGNFIVVSPMIVSVLQSASKSVFAPAVEGSFKGPNNTQLVGTLNGSIKVYSYLWNQVGSAAYDGASPGASDSILVGYKGGNGETDAGYFYCPYVPLMSSGVVINPTTFQPVVSLMTRYGKAAFTNSTTSLGNSADYYGKITVSNLIFA